MFLIARKNLFTEKMRLIISVTGVAFAVLLIIILWGLYLDWQKRIGSYLDSIPTDLWIKQAGAGDMFHGLSLLPEKLKSEIEEVEGIKEINKFIGKQIKFKIGEEEKVLFLIGYDKENGIGRPLKIVAGKEIQERGEIIIDRVFMKKNKLKIGDSISIRDRDFKIVGISEGGNMLLYQYAFLEQKDVQEIFNLPDLTNYFLVKVNEGFDPEKVKEKIEEKFPQVDSLSKEKFIEDNTKIIDEAFLPILYVLSLIGMLAGVAIIGLTTYTATIEKSREFGILKAIGMENSSLYQIVFIQSLISSIFGFILGVILSYLVAFLSNQLVPEFSVSIGAFNLILAGVSSILMGILASYIPMRKIVKIDPALVFKT